MKNLFVKSNIPNAITCFRTLLVVPLIFYVFKREAMWFVGLFVVIKILDYLDGTIARKYGWVSDFGSRLDSYTDMVSDLLAFGGFYIIKPSLFSDYWLFWLIAFGALFYGWIYGYVINKKFIVLHLKTNRIFGSLYFLYLVIGVVYKTIPSILIMSMLFALIACVEQILIFKKYGKDVDLKIEQYFNSTNNVGGVSISEKENNF